MVSKNISIRGYNSLVGSAFSNNPKANNRVINFSFPLCPFLYPPRGGLKHSPTKAVLLYYLKSNHILITFWLQWLTAWVLVERLAQYVLWLQDVPAMNMLGYHADHELMIAEQQRRMLLTTLFIPWRLLRGGSTLQHDSYTFYESKQSSPWKVKFKD